MFGQVGPAFSKLTGGYVRVVRLNERVTDGALIGRVEWAHPIVIKWQKDEKPTSTSTAKVEKKVSTK